MSKIVIINGSPKIKVSVSKMLIDFLQRQFSQPAPVFQATQLIEKLADRDELSALLQSDALLLVFPLYIDALPAPLVKLLNSLEALIAEEQPKKLPALYMLVNCGFFEAHHNFLAKEIVENFALACGFNWNNGLAIGCGGSLLTFATNCDSPVTQQIYKQLKELAQAIDTQQELQETKFIQPQMPRITYMLSGNLAWRKAAKKRNTRLSLKAKPHIAS